MPASPASWHQRCSPLEPARPCAGPAGRAAGAHSPGGHRLLLFFFSFFPLPSAPLPGSVLPASASRRYSLAPSAKPLFIGSLLRARAAAFGASPATAVLGGWQEASPSLPGSCQLAKPGSPLPPCRCPPDRAGLSPRGGRCQAPPALVSHLKGSAATGGLQRGFPALFGCWHCGGAPGSELPACSKLVWHGYWLRCGRPTGFGVISGEAFV